MLHQRSVPDDVLPLQVEEPWVKKMTIEIPPIFNKRDTVDGWNPAPVYR